MSSESALRKQGRLAARSQFQLGLIVLSIAVLSSLRWGISPFLKIGVLISAILFVVAGIEWWGSRHGRPQSTNRPETRIEVSAGATPSFVLVVRKGKTYLERFVKIDDAIVRITTPSANPTLMEDANWVCDNTQKVSAEFQQFKAAQALRHQHYSDEILALRLNAMTFSPTSDAEVTFDAGSGGDVWVCGWDGCKFSDLEWIA